MDVTQIRSDTFDSNGDFVRVQARKDHVISTDLATTMEFKVTATVQKHKYRDDTFDARVAKDYKCLPAHMPEEKEIEVRDLIVNRSIDKCILQADTSVNGWEHSPATRADLLPYCTERDVYDNACVPQTRSFVASEWTDIDGNVTAMPIAGRNFYMKPTLFGNMFIGDSDETRILERCALPQRNIVPLIANSGILDKEPIFQIVTETQKNRLLHVRPAIRDMIQNPAGGAYNFQVNDHIDMVIPFAFERVTDHKVYRTNFQANPRYVVVSAVLIETAQQSQDMRNKGYFVCPMTFNLELSFGADGKAVTRAISFEGEDITDRVSVGGFLRMDLLATNSTVTGYMVGRDEDGDIEAAIQLKTDIEEVTNVPQSFYIPKRRFTFTDRSLVATDETNTPENASVGLNFIYDLLKADRERVVNRGQVHELFERNGSLSQNLMSGFQMVGPQADVDEHFAGVDEEKFEDAANGNPVAVPIYGAAAGGIRSLHAFDIFDATTLDYLQLIQDLYPAGQPSPTFMLRMRRAQRLAYIGDAANFHTKYAVTGNANNTARGWVQGNAPVVAQNFLANENRDLYIFFQRDQIVNANNRKQIHGYIFFGQNGTRSPATQALITAKKADRDQNGTAREQAIMSEIAMKYSSQRTNRLFMKGYDKRGSLLPNAIDLDTRLIDNALRHGPRLLENGYVQLIRANEFFEVATGEHYTNAIIDAVVAGLTCDRVYLNTIAAENIYADVYGDKQERRLCKASIEIEEPLLSFGGGTRFMPSQMFERVAEFPPIVQDFSLQLRTKKPFIRKDDCTEDQLVFVFEPTKNFSVNISSQNSFLQEDKSLQTIDQNLLDTVTFSKTFIREEGGVYKVPFNTIRGPPSYVFVRLERDGSKFDEFSRYPAVLDGIALETIDQDIKSISTLTEYRLKRATVKNSNPRSDAQRNYETIGGSILSAPDFCSWHDFKFYSSKDTMSGTFIVEDHKIRDVPQGVLSGENREALSAQAIKILITFVYTDFKVSGEASTMEFRYPPERMEKLFI